VSATQPGQDFGANDWLVEEMYERYQSDPSSVTAEWIEFFKTYSPTTPGSATAGSATTSAAGAPKGGTPPVPKSAQTQSSAPAAAQPAAPVSAPAQPVVAQPVAQQVVTPPVAASVSNPTPAQAVVKPAPVLATPGEATVEPLRGVAGRVVASMEASLSVPTATSVRAIPAKLMIDNRTVINTLLNQMENQQSVVQHISTLESLSILQSQMDRVSFLFHQLRVVKHLISASSGLPMNQLLLRLAVELSPLKTLLELLFR